MYNDNKKFFSYKLVAKQYDISEDEAKKLIMLGLVFLNEDKTYKITNDQKFKANQKFWKKVNLYTVSRGEEKLRKAIKDFEIIIKDKVCLDIGSSTGGFSKVLLDNKAKFIYAVDAGSNQLNYSLRINPIIKSMENYNFKYAKYSDFNEKMDIITIDVSHISVIKIINVLKDFLKNNTDIIVLVKPQFEAEYDDVDNGLVKNKDIHYQIIYKVIENSNLYKLYLKNIIFSPILGKNKKNIEYFLYLTPIAYEIKDLKKIITNIIDKAWEELYDE